MRRTIALTAAIGAVGAGLLIKRDRDEQRQLDQLSSRVAELSQAARALTVPLQALPSLLSQQRCSLDPHELDRLLRMAPERATEPNPAVATPAGGANRPEPARLSPEQETALHRAHKTFESALSRHSLTRDDVLEMRAQLATVGSIQESEALRSRIATAINHQELVPKDRLFIMP